MRELLPQLTGVTLEVEELYKGTYDRMKNSEGETRRFWAPYGVRQGSTKGPVLFIMLYTSVLYKVQAGREVIDAFIALGGNADKTGNVQADKLRGIIKEFGLTIDIDRLIREVDTDHSGLIDYQEFAVMMKS